MKTLLRTHPAPRLSQGQVCAGRVRLGHMTNSLFTLQTTPRPRREPRPGRSLDLLQTPDGAPDGAPDGGGERVRTDDLLLAKQALSQLSYTPFQKTVIRDQQSELLITVCR